jgi:hypothetical protein
VEFGSSEGHDAIKELCGFEHDQCSAEACQEEVRQCLHCHQNGQVQFHILVKAAKGMETAGNPAAL